MGSHFLFDFHFTPTFILGVLLVIAAILLYGDVIRVDQLCPAVCCFDGLAGERELSAERLRLTASIDHDAGDEEHDFNKVYIWIYR